MRRFLVRDMAYQSIQKTTIRKHVKTFYKVMRNGMQYSKKAVRWNPSAAEIAIRN